MAINVLPDYCSLGFIGPGKMAESIARGVVKSGILPANRICTASHRNKTREDVFQSFGVNIVENNKQVVKNSTIIFISVKPQIVKKVLVELKDDLNDKILVSIAAGIKLKDLQELSGHDRFIRVMPNTPSAVGEAASVMARGDGLEEKDVKYVSDILGAVGKIWEIEEKYFDAVTGLSGSGPAYMYLAIEAMADGAVAAGLTRDLALNLASQTVLGAATMATQSGKHPGQLKDDVTSPAGTTIAGVHELEKGGFRGILMNAVCAAANRSRELSS